MCMVRAIVSLTHTVRFSGFAATSTSWCVVKSCECWYFHAWPYTNSECSAIRGATKFFSTGLCFKREESPRAYSSSLLKAPTCQLHLGDLCTLFRIPPSCLVLKDGLWGTQRHDFVNNCDPVYSRNQWALPFSGKIFRGLGFIMARHK